MKLLLNVVQLLLLCLNVSLQNARPLLQLLLQLVHYTELRLLRLIHGRRLLLCWLLLERHDSKDIFLIFVLGKICHFLANGGDNQLSHIIGLFL